MKKNYIKMMSLVAVLALTACGGSGSKGESPRERMSKKDSVLIFYNYPENLCRSKTFKELAEQRSGIKNVLLQVESNDVTCNTYGKSYPMCDVSYNTSRGDKSCVIGFDVDIRDRRFNKLTTSDEENIIEAMIVWADEAQWILLK